MAREQIKVLFAGESWMTYSTHVKGFDVFSTCEYQEGGTWLISALESSGILVDYLPNHLASVKFPLSMEQLKQYDVIILSDIGSNTLLLHPDVFLRSRRTPNRLELLKRFVEAGGGFMMIGGYMSFQGIEGKARYKGSPVEEILPVTLESGDDRVEVPEGFTPRIVQSDHPVVSGIPLEWPFLLFYNKTALKESATLVAEYNGDPILALSEYGSGRVIAYTADCGPAGAPPEFLNWSYYPRLWVQMVLWLSKRL